MPKIVKIGSPIKFAEDTIWGEAVWTASTIPKPYHTLDINMKLEAQNPSS